jgi:hypothetical protein
MAAAMAAASGGSYLSVLPASTSAIPFLSPQNAVQLAQAKQGTTSYGFHHRRAQGEGCDCSVLPASASSFSFSTVFDSNSRKLRMHRKPKSKWLHDREGIAVEARIEEFSSDDFEWSACWVPMDTSTFPGIQLDWVPPFLLQVFGSQDVETSLPSFLEVPECKLSCNRDRP